MSKCSSAAVAASTPRSLVRISRASRVEGGDLVGVVGGEQAEVGHDHLVGDAHDLAVDVARVFGDADVVAQRLAHALDAVGAGQNADGHDGLRLLTEVLLQVAAHEEVELLLGAAQLDV